MPEAEIAFLSACHMIEPTGESERGPAFHCCSATADFGVSLGRCRYSQEVLQRGVLIHRQEAGTVITYFYLLVVTTSIPLCCSILKCHNTSPLVYLDGL